MGQSPSLPKAVLSAAVDMVARHWKLYKLITTNDLALQISSYTDPVLEILKVLSMRIAVL
jgi:hypothetical protein